MKSVKPSFYGWIESIAVKCLQRYDHKCWVHFEVRPCSCHERLSSAYAVNLQPSCISFISWITKTKRTEQVLLYTWKGSAKWHCNRTRLLGDIVHNEIKRMLQKVEVNHHYIVPNCLSYIDSSRSYGWTSWILAKWLKTIWPSSWTPEA